MYKCWICGAEATKTRRFGSSPFGDYESLLALTKATLEDNRRSYCEKCYEKYLRTISEENALYSQLKRKRMIEIALDKLERQHIDMWRYKEAIDAVIEYNDEHPDKFDSAAEVMAAVILIQNRIRIKPQYKVDKYQVDFLLPDAKIVLEIDGERHRSKRVKDTIRDDFIRHKLGDEWRVIRIPDDNIYTKAEKLIDGIDAVIEYRKEQKRLWRDR